MNPISYGKRIIQKKVNKIYLNHYLKNGKVDSLENVCDEGILETKWSYRDACCYVESRSAWEVKDNIDLSVIIPLYNSEKFLEKCIGRFTAQKTDYKFEVILVNDGSKDNTYQHAKEYQNQYGEWLVVLNQENQGISCARNAGIRAARGRYLSFVDHDDLVDERFVEKLMSVAYKEDADIVKAAHAKVVDGKIKQVYEQTDEIIMGQMGSKLLQYAGYIFPGVYKRELFEHVNFPEKYWYEDMIVRMLLYRQATKFVHISDVLYYKQFHSGNAFEVVWNDKNSKCLEQLYLVINLIETSHKLGLQDDAWFYRCVLREFSTIFYQRIKNLDEQTKQTAFLKACEILDSLYRSEYSKVLDEKDSMWHRTFSQKEYTLWVLLGGQA